ncbi:type II secretion system F family protein [Salinibaculum rarum]|uniref:type II secretion system F family protein n=1 Tax=Salinibaculum rarum TaxID=3058903 RepID=UPI00265D7FAE|nr:type II secretion system F family protein [Salinibaculum sp. KK48]
MSEQPGAAERTWLIRQTAWLYEPLRRFFADRSDRHEGLRSDLNAARVPVTAAGYLARSVVFALLAVVFGVVAGLLTAILLSELGHIAALTGIGSLGAVSAFASAYRFPIVAAALAVGFGLAAGAGTWYIRYYLPRYVAGVRAKKLNLMLPSAISYMYALSRGGLDIVEVFRRLAAAEETYEEMSQEAGLVLNHVDYLGRDFMQALREASEVTPCDYTAEFFTDLLGVIESGGDTEAFLADQRNEALQDARVVQDSYIENIALFAEVYVTVLIAGPLFLLILLMVMGITGLGTLELVNVVVYAGIPVASALALLILDQLGEPFRQSSSRPSDTATHRPELPDDPEAAAYARRKQRLSKDGFVSRFLSRCRSQPPYVLVASVPLSALVVGLTVWSGTVSLSLSSLFARPLVATTLLFVVPFVIATLPLVGFHELRQRRLNTILRRFPDVLSSIAGATRMGVRPPDAIASTAERSEGPLSAELKRTHNEMEWFDDMRGALVRLARRAQTRIVTRTLRLVIDADEASGNLSETLSVAAEDARNQRQFLQRRSQELSSYVVAAFISFFVYLGIILLINEFYFEQALALGQQSTVSSPDLPISLQGIDADGFQVAFVHSSLVQSLFIGLVAGKMGEGRILAGLKYSLAMIVITIVAFGVV